MLSFCKNLIFYFHSSTFFREIDHRMSIDDWTKESSDLYEMIRFMGLPVDTEEMYINGYTDPMALRQKNELWKVKI